MLSDVEMGEEIDDWLTMFSPSSINSSSSDSTSSPPHLRVKLKYKHDVILPVKAYQDLQNVKIISFIVWCTGV